MFSASHLYQFQKLGDDDDEPEWASTSYPSCGMADPSTPLPHAFLSLARLRIWLLRTKSNLYHPSSIPRFCQILTIHRFSLRVAVVLGAHLELYVTASRLEESVSSDFPGIPNAVWTTKRKEDGEPIA
jgi:splicing factor 3B subunit 3